MTGFLGANRNGCMLSAGTARQIFSYSKLKANLKGALEMKAVLKAIVAFVSLGVVLGLSALGFTAADLAAGGKAVAQWNEGLQISRP